MRLARADLRRHRRAAHHGPEHFSLEPNDQTNIDSMFTAVTLGATQYPYHSDGAQCKMYSAVDIVTLYVAYKTL